MKKANNKRIFGPVQYAGFGLLAIVMLCAYLVFVYVDLLNVIDNSNILLSAVRHGKLLSFYEYSVEKASFNYPANYNLPVFILFAVWQAPMLLLTKLLGKEYLRWPVSILWSKLLLVLFMIAVAAVMYRIVLLCTKKRRRGILAVYLYFSSMMAFFPVLICGQLEVIPVFFMLTGLYFYLQERWLLFWLSFLIAVPLKYFALLMALPLLLLREKNLHKVFALMGSMAGLVIFEKILYSGSIIYHYALSSQNSDVVEGIMEAASFMGRPVILFVSCYLALLIWAYSRAKADKAEILYMCCFLWSTFIAFSYTRSYWMFLAAPFVMMSLCVRGEYLREGILVETIGSLCVFFRLGTSGAATVRDPGLVDQLLLPRIMSVPTEDLKYGTLSALFEKTGIMQYYELFSTVYVTALIAMLVLTAPVMPKRKERPAGPDRMVLLLRPVILGFCVVTLIYSFTAKGNPVLYNTRDATAHAAGCDLITDGGSAVLCQKIVIRTESAPEEITLKFSNDLVYRANMALFTVRIVSLASDETVAYADITCSEFPDDADKTIRLKSAKMTPGEYEIRLSAKEGTEVMKSQSALYPYLTDGAKEGLENCRFNGETLDGSLYFELR